jgi:hypothetical protein
MSSSPSAAEDILAAGNRSADRGVVAQHIASPDSPPAQDGGIQESSSNQGMPDEEEEFVTLVSVLFKILHRSGESKLLTRARAIVRDVTSRNGRGDPDCTPLRPCLTRCLRELVGEVYWSQTKLYVRHLQYKKQRG